MVLKLKESVLIYNHGFQKIKELVKEPFSRLLIICWFVHEKCEIFGGVLENENKRFFNLESLKKLELEVINKIKLPPNTCNCHAQNLSWSLRA
jgi:hypothetical protein